MNDFEPRYTLTFRPGAPETIVVGVFTVLGAAFLVFLAYFFREFECYAEALSECSTGGLAQLLIATGGLIPAVGTLVASTRPRAHPWRWFLATGLVYVFWALGANALYG